jgi:(p)ppGpp synthase/HD superfamily hydrolase
VHIQQDQEKILAAITDFADIAHGSQMRKYTPERYIVHPARVMRLCQEYTDDVTVLAAALLHDVLEDTPYHGG